MTGRRAMGRGSIPRAVLLVAVALVALCTALEAGGPVRRTGPRATWRLVPGDPATVAVSEPRVALAPVTVHEIARALGGATAVAAISAGPRDAAGAPDARIERRLESAWSIRLPADEDGSATALDVEVRVVAPNGAEGRLLEAAGGDSEIAARALALAPQLVSRGADGVLYEGSLVLELDLARAHLAGDYTGTLMITVNQY